ncbi:MAG TPA: DUF6106 family protein [Lachnospiraceae bacterium]|nr:DUF6106 family protein [Lachnospiraceae bacterium]
MGETYIELLVKKKQTTADLLLRYALLGLTISFGLVGIVFQPIILFGALIFGVITYFVNLFTDLEYEYCYLDKQITIDKVMARTKRKKIMTIEFDRMEILAPLNSHQLDVYKNRPGKVIDYSSGQAKQPESRYMMIYDGGKKIILEPNEEMLKMIRSVAPRKTFLD